MADDNQDENTPASAGLRQMFLEAQYKDFDLDAPSSENEVWGIMMETGFPEGSYSLACVSDGNASLYFSSGGGIIGAGQHANVKAEAMTFVKLSNDYVSDMTHVTQFPKPDAGKTTFYAKTRSGVWSVTLPEEDLGADRHKLSPLFYKAHGVIAEIRKVSNQ